MSLIQNLSTKKQLKNSLYGNSSFSQTVNFGQELSHCAGVSAAVLIAFHNGQIEGGILQKNELKELFNLINTKSQELYAIRYENSLNEDVVLVEGFIELMYIRNNFTADKRNILKVNNELSITIETPLAMKFDEKGAQIPLTDYREEWNYKRFPEVFRHYMASRSNAVFYANYHYITILTMGEKFMVIDGVPKYGLYWYENIDTLLIDLVSFVGNSKFTLHHARIFGDNDFDVILESLPGASNALQVTDFITLEDEEEDYERETFTSFHDDKLGELKEEAIALSEDQKKAETIKQDQVIEEDNEENDDNSVDPDTIKVFDNAAEIRNFLKELCRDRLENKEIELKLATDESDKCRINGCPYYADPIYRGAGAFCKLHYSIAGACATLINGRSCETKGCKRKPKTFKLYCSTCLKERINAKKKSGEKIENNADNEEKNSHENDDDGEEEEEEDEKVPQWSEKKIKEIAMKIAKKFYKMILADPSLMIYFGITIRALNIRLGEHLQNGKNFDLAFMEIEVPHAQSLADLEYYVILYFWQLAGGIHLRNRTAGGDYWLPNMNRPGVLYVLLFENAVTDATRDTGINFAFRRSMRYRNFPVVTPKLHITLPKINRIIYQSEVLKKLGYDMKKSFFDIAKERDEGHQCDVCKMFFPSNSQLAKHKHELHQGRIHKCHLCPNTFKQRQLLKNHLKRVHGIIVPLIVKTKKTEYICEEKGCGAIFANDQKLYHHRIKVHVGRTKDCKVCGASFYFTNHLNTHLENIHGENVKRSRNTSNPTPFPCEFCDPVKYLKNPDVRNMHYRRCHKKELNKKREEEKLNKKKK